MTSQPEPGASARAGTAQWPGADPGRRPGSLHRGLIRAALVVLLCLGLCGLAASAAGVARQLLPRQFTAAQQRQIMAWEMSRRWRAMSAGQIFPALVGYEIPAQALDSSQGLSLEARRLGVAPEENCGAGLSRAAATVLAEGRCMALLRATYVDASASILVTIGIAVVPDSAIAARIAQRLSAAGQGLTVRPLSVPGTPAATFGAGGWQLSQAIGAGPYVILSTTGFTDGRPHLRLSSDYYEDQEMASLADGLADSAASRLGAEPAVPTCPQAPGC